MTSPFGGGDLGDEQVYNPTLEAVTFWDLSEKPTANDRIKKLGADLASRAQALLGYDEKKHLGDFSDALPKTLGTPTQGGTKPVVSLRLYEPDNWALRLHEENGRGRDSVWALRFISDHSNYARERECRSTMVIDQDEKAQSWAWLSDLTWLVDLGTSVQDNELAFNGAGFLSMLYAGGKPVKKRAALAINIAGNAGFLTQGTAIGQLQHIITIVGAAQGTLTRPTKQTEAALRGDVHFFTQKGLAQFYHEPMKTKDVYTDEPREVHFYVSEVDAPSLGMDAPDDLLSNHKKIARLAAKQWRAWVKVPRGGGDSPKYDYSYHSDPPPKPGSGGGGGGGGTETGGAVGEGERAPTASAPEDNPDGRPCDEMKDQTQGSPNYPEGNYEYDPVTGEYAPVTPEHFENHARQARLGFAGWKSPGYCQRVNTFSHPEDGHQYTNDTAQWTITKPEGYKDIRITTHIKVAEAIPAGQSITMDLKIMPMIDGKIPDYQTGIYGRQIVLDENTPAGIDAEFSVITAYFSGFPVALTKCSVWFERRSDNGTLDPDQDANVEVWVLSHDPSYELGT